MMIMNRFIVAMILLSVCVQMAGASSSLSVQINCQGCFNKVEIPGGWQFYVDEGKTVSLAASLSGGIGEKNYNWTNDGEMISDRASFSLTVVEDIEYVLVVMDDKGSVNKLVKISSRTAKESRCLPSFERDYITLRGGLHDAKYSIGGRFFVEVSLDTGDCRSSDYQFYWRADDENIIFLSPNSIKTEVVVGSGTKIGRVEIEAVITNGIADRNRKIEIEVVKNKTLLFKIGFSEPVLSYTPFSVYCVDFESGSDDGFLYKYSVVLKDEWGKVVDDDFKIGSNRGIPNLKLKPRGIGIYTLELTAWNSYGAFTIVKTTIEVDRGTTGEDIPIIRSPKSISCIVGEVCLIDASKTDRDVSTFRFYNADTGEQLVNPEGHYCSGPKCKHIFTYPGIYRIRIEGNYFNNDNVGINMVTVSVKSVNASTPTPTLKPTPTPPCVSDNNGVRIRPSTMEELRGSSSGGAMGFFWKIIEDFKNALNS